MRDLLAQASSKGSKSTILKPLAWMLGICVTSTLTSAKLDLPPWITILFSIFAAITMFLYLIAYLYCLIKDRDALRSETYSIQKMVVERGFVGDDINGSLPVDRTPTGHLIESDSAIDGKADK
ncbi:hypothetical protein J3D48_005673 [Pseudomonas fluorescens]|uniref:hypothetical protein n=1 Tax=Pseudomonas fluorescens TaxID=294 RepID=UPI0020A051DF|nr:hypothetical protein [Pseudomonas fluorescens]MCP1489360.1 hypothetical protein [Pseudomonas fluorescens]